MVTGGFCGGKPTDMVQTIDVATNQVDNLASLNSQRYAHSCMATSWGGQDYVVVAGRVLMRQYKRIRYDILFQ